SPRRRRRFSPTQECGLRWWKRARAGWRPTVPSPPAPSSSRTCWRCSDAMRLLFVVQRYGREEAGGAELLCREFASRMATRGHDVEAITSCATGYLDWANVYPAGDTEIDGVLVHRLPVAAERDLRFFGPLDQRAVWGAKPVPLYLQRAWMRYQGPYLPDLAP